MDVKKFLLRKCYNDPIFILVFTLYIYVYHHFVFTWRISNVIIHYSFSIHLYISGGSSLQCVTADEAYTIYQKFWTEKISDKLIFSNFDSIYALKTNLYRRRPQKQFPASFIFKRIEIK